MKKAYFKPEIEITDFTTEDIITASSVDSGLTRSESVVDVDTLPSVDLKGDVWN